MDIRDALERTLGFLNQGWVGVVIGVLVSLYFYRKADRRARLTYSALGIPIVQGSHAELLAADIEVSYRGKVIPRVSVATVTIWNTGNATLEGAAIADADPLRIRSLGGEILAATIVRWTNLANAVKLVEPEGGEVRVNFDYLDPKDGVTVRVVHTSMEPAPSLGGSMKGIKIEALPFSIEVFTSSRIERVFSGVVNLLPVLILVMVFAGGREFASDGERVAMGAVALLMLAISVTSWARRNPLTPPAKLRGTSAGDPERKQASLKSPPEV